MIIGINESKTLSECKCKFYGRSCNSDQWWNNDKCRCECKKRHACKKDYVWNPATCNCENGKYLASIPAQKTIFPKSWNIMESLKRPSKYHLFINFLAEKVTVLPISEKFKTRTFQQSLNVIFPSNIWLKKTPISYL